MNRSPKEPWEGPPRSVIRFFTTRGYTLVAPMRRGYGESTGTYVEECSVYAGKCTREQQTVLADRALSEALLDVNAVLDQLVLGRLAARDARILLAGHSRGGYLSLVLAGERPGLVRGVFNFAGGWLGVTEGWPEADIARRIEAQNARLAAAARKAKVPTLWVYAVRDVFYGEPTVRGFFRAWQEGGGQGEFLWIGEHNQPNAHAAFTNLSLWEKAGEALLQRMP